MVSTAVFVAMNRELMTISAQRFPTFHSTLANPYRRPFSIARNCTILHDYTMTKLSLIHVSKPLLVLIAGPYLSGANGDAQKIAHNRQRLESFALPIYERGHLPIVGEWMALPIIHAAGGRSTDDAVFRAYQYPVAHRLLECCDAVLRIPGESHGADLDVSRARELGLAVYTDVSELPLRGATP
jgi:hypothetical protein